MSITTLFHVEHVLQSGQRQEEPELLARAAQPHGLPSSRGVLLDENQDAEPRAVHQPGQRHIDHQAALPFGKLIQQAHGRPPKFGSGIYSKVGRRDNYPIVSVHA